MPDLELSEMTAASTADGTELLYAVQGGADRKMTVAQVNASRQPLDGTLTALSGLDADPGYVYQSSVDTYIKRMPTAADMSALRTFVRPLSAATNVGGGFYQSNLFRFTLANPDAFAAQLILCVKITDASVKTGSMYVESPLHGTRDGSTMGSNLPAGLLRSNYNGTSGTSIGFSQLAASTASPNVDFTFLVSPTGFSSPTVSMSAIVVCPGDVTVTVL